MMDITSLMNDVQDLKRDMALTKTCLEKLTQRVEKVEKTVAEMVESKRKEETDQSLQMDMYVLGVRVGQLEKLVQTKKVELELASMKTQLAYLEAQINSPNKIVPEMPCDASSTSKKVLNKSQVTEIPGFRKIVARACETQNWISCKVWLETKLEKECLAWCELEPLEKNSHKNLPIVSSRCGFAGIISVLLAHGLCVNDVVDGGEEPFVSDGYGMLHCAVAGHHTKLVKLLLREGAQVEMKGKDGKTPLHVAAEEGHLDIVTLLVVCGSDTKVKDAKYKTPLCYAIDNKRPEVIEYLRQYI